MSVLPPSSPSYEFDLQRRIFIYKENNKLQVDLGQVPRQGPFHDHEGTLIKETARYRQAQVPHSTRHDVCPRAGCDPQAAQAPKLIHSDFCECQQQGGARGIAAARLIAKATM